ncbi:MFS transporter [Novosphingobium sp. TH158]|uniref:MFS transporter n=1 Tax=Novosphingobium sp. TH158 TaxID=2067455 RepID=UPI000C7B67C9|nr:MFS transporter [Novosphingobium sp. TH158]PLK27456.1 MFS transporter [Novosphingobium sp. TH158]
MTYVRELRDNWRPLLAATIGVGTGMSLAGTVISTMAPSLIKSNGWSPSDFAYVGTLGLFSSLVLPFVGRLADVLGVRMTALIGMVAMPVIYLLLSLMDGSIGTYSMLFVAQGVIGMTTTATVFCRLAVQYIQKSRGMALAIVASGPALFGMIVGPILNSIVETQGWRDGYQFLAMFAVVAGIVTFLLIPPGSKSHGVASTKRRARDDYPMIFRNPAFWMLGASMLLCNLPQTIPQAQLKNLILENGMTGMMMGQATIALLLGQLSGRLIAGFAIDRMNPYRVAFLTMALPSIGLFFIASSMDAHVLLLLSVYFIGFTFGAEGDVVAFLVARRFGVGVYSSVMGLITAITSFSTSIGAAFLGFTLAKTGNFVVFLLVTGVGVILGSLLLLLLGRNEKLPEEA